MIEYTIVMAVAWIVFDELQDHAKEGKFKPSLSTLSGKKNWAKEWLNTPTAWKNKHNWSPSWLFSGPLVMFTDGEHMFQFIKRTIVCAMLIPFIGVWFALLVRVVAWIISGVMNEYFLKKK